MTKSLEDLENEMDDLDVPFVPITSILEILGDAFDIDPVEFLNTLDHESALADMITAHGKQEITLMQDCLYEAIESSTQIPHIRRGIGIQREIADLLEG